MGRKRGSFGNSTLERLAMSKARPVNRDALNVVEYKPAPSEAKPKKKPTGIKPAPLVDGQKVRVFKASAESARKARMRGVFGFKRART